MAEDVRLGERPDAAELDRLMSVYRYGRYLENPRIPPERSRAHERVLLEGLLARDDATVFSLGPADRLRGVLIARDSAWDREHFGYGVAVIETILTAEEGYPRDRAVAERLLEAFLDWCRSRAVRFASMRLSSRQLPVIHALEAAGFRYIESYIYNVVDLDRVPPAAEPVAALRHARPEDQEYMCRYAHGAFTTHRFHADPFVDPAKAESLYFKWIQSAFADPGRKVLVMDQDGRPAAFMVYRDEDWRHTLGLRSASLNMGLLDPEARGRGLGTRFYHALFEHFRKEGFHIVESGLSLRNQVSLNWHNRTGFRVVSTHVTLHRWWEGGP